MTSVLRVNQGLRLWHRAASGIRRSRNVAQNEGLADGARQLGYLLHPGAVEDPGLPSIELAAVARLT